MHTLHLSAVICLRPAPLAIGYLALATSLQAQSKVAGKWLVQYEHEVRSGHMGTGPSHIAIDTVRMTLRQKGDSVLGEWQAIPKAGGAARNPKMLVGVVRGETALVEVDPSVAITEGYFAELGREVVEFIKEHVHGIQPMTTKLELTSRGDSLVGVRWSSSADGTNETPRRPLVGIREKP